VANFLKLLAGVLLERTVHGKPRCRGACAVPILERDGAKREAVAGGPARLI
jgi:hypothetical protein